MALVVELQAFSGRDNPRFALSPDDEAELRRLIGQCAPTADFTRRPPRLGLQGLVVYGQTAVGSWQPWFTLAEGVATAVIGPGAGQTHPAPAVEAFLLHAAERAGLTSVLKGESPNNRAPDNREG